MSKLLGFSYLRFRHLVVLVLILAMVSCLFLVTSLSFLGVYRSFNDYLGEEADVVAVYDKQSRTPFTGSIPAYLADAVCSVDGVLASSPETLSPCVVNGQSIFVRGVLPDAFLKINNVSFVEGKILSYTDFGSVLIGKNLVDRLKLAVGDRVLVYAVLVDRYFELKVAGVFVSGSSMDDEALVLLNVGQWLRFADYNHVTLIRVKVAPKVMDSEGIYYELAKYAQASNATSLPSNSPSQASSYQSLLPFGSEKFGLETLGVKRTQNVMTNYLNRYGVTKEALVVLSVLVFLFSSLTVTAASQTLVRQHKESFETLRFVGASKRALKLDVLLKLLPLTLIACGLGAAVSFAVLFWFEGFNSLTVLSHGLFFSFEPLVLVLNFVLVAVLVGVSVLRADFD
jgi:ABC-type lipoprotein release transport system permease subunit